MSSSQQRSTTVLFALCLGAMCWVLFTSLHPKEDSYIVVGQLNAIEGSLEGATLRYTTDSDDRDFARMKIIDVKADGSFNSVINVIEQAVVHFYVEKKGYTRTYSSHLLRGNGAENNLGKIPFSSLYKGPFKGKEDAPTMLLFTDVCLENLYTDFSVTEIEYFKELRAYPSLTGCNLPTDHVIFAAQVVLTDGSDSFNGYFSLKRQPNGDAHIVSADQYPSLSGKTMLVSQKGE